MISKENILNQISEEQIFKQYIGHDFKLSVPFLSELQPEEHASANVFRSSKSGSLLYKDFRRDDTLNCFGYVMELYGCDFKGSLTIVAKDFNILPGKVTAKKIIKIPKIFQDKPRAMYEYQIKEWNISEEQYWLSFGITRAALDEYEIIPLEWFLSIKKGMDFPETESTKENPIFLILIGEGIKIYRPMEEPRKKWLSNTRAGDIFGLKQAQEAAIHKRLDKLGLLAGQKDILSLYSNTGIRSVGLSSEGAKLRFMLYLSLKEIAEWLFILYDNDKTGIRQSEKIAFEYVICPILMNRFLRYSIFNKKSNGINDVADWYKYMIDHDLKKDRIKLLIEYEQSLQNKSNSSK